MYTLAFLAAFAGGFWTLRFLGSKIQTTEDEKFVLIYIAGVFWVLCGMVTQIHNTCTQLLFINSEIPIAAAYSVGFIGAISWFVILVVRGKL